MNLTDSVKLLGFRTDIQDLLISSDIFVFPSIREGLPISIMEAMDAGLPCIVSNIRGNKDLIDSKGGYLFKNSIELLQYLVNLIEDSNLRLQMGAHNKNKVKLFSIEKVIKYHKELYGKL